MIPQNIASHYHAINEDNNNIKRVMYFLTVAMVDIGFVDTFTTLKSSLDVARGIPV